MPKNLEPVPYGGHLENRHVAQIVETLLGQADATIDLSGAVTLSGPVAIEGALTVTGNIGFFDVAPAPRSSPYTRSYTTTTRTLSTPPENTYTGSTVGACYNDLNDLRAYVVQLARLCSAYMDDFQEFGLFGIA